LILNVHQEKEKKKEKEEEEGKEKGTGEDLGWTGGMVPQNLRWGNGPCIRPPNILISTVTGCEVKYELTKEGPKEEFFVLK